MAFFGKMKKITKNDENSEENVDFILRICYNYLINEQKI